MAILDDICDDITARAAERRGPGKQHGTPVAPPRHAGERQWPVLAVPQAPKGPSVATLENTIAKQAAELSLRCTQVADLYNLQQQQANELQVACDEIDRLSTAISALLETQARHETEAAAAQQKLTDAENEKAALRMQLEKTLQGSVELSRRLLAIETAFNDRETAIASASEKTETLTTELTAASAEKFKMVAANEGQKLRLRSELSQQKSAFEKRIRENEVTIETQSVQIKELTTTRDRLAKRVEVLHTLMKSEREAAEFKAKELADELRCERKRHSAEDDASAAMRQDITLLLPKLAEQRSQSSVPELGADRPHNNAA